MLYVFLILIGIAFLIGVWYNGKNYGERKVIAEATKAEADASRDRVTQLETQRAEENEASRRKDLSEAEAVGSNSRAALDFLVRSHKDGRGSGSH